MPGLVHKDKIVKCLQDVQAELEKKQFALAWEKLKLVRDSITAIDGKDGDGNPIPLPENGHLFYTEIEDENEKQKMIQDGIITGKKIDLAKMHTDIGQILFQFNQNNFSTAQLDNLIVELKNNDPKYQDPGTQGDHILQARVEIKKAAVIIVTDTIMGEFVPTAAAEAILEKHIDKTYKDGYEQGKKETQKQSDSN